MQLCMQWAGRGSPLIMVPEQMLVLLACHTRYVADPFISSLASARGKDAGPGQWECPGSNGEGAGAGTAETSDISRGGSF